MNHLIPPPENLPVSWGWLKVLLMIVFPLHLLFMNAMLGSVIIAIYSGLRNDETSRDLSRRLAGIIPIIIAFAINLGVASLLFIQVLYGRFFYVSSILMAVSWLAVIPLLMTAYYLMYLYDFRFPSLGGKGVIAATAAFLIFLFIAFVYSNNMTLMLAPDAWQVYFANRQGTILNLAEPTLWPRYLHFTIGGTAIGSLFVALYGKYLVKRGTRAGEAAVAVGMKIFTVLTLVQVVGGLWFLQSIPDTVRRVFIGVDPFSTTLFLVGVMLALAAIMAAAVRNVYLTATIAIPLVYVMTFIRDRVRSAYLQPYYSPEKITALPQYLPMVLFFSILVAGATVIAWMLIKCARFCERKGV